MSGVNRRTELLFVKGHRRHSSTRFPLRLFAAISATESETGAQSTAWTWECADGPDNTAASGGHHSADAMDSRRSRHVTDIRCFNTADSPFCLSDSSARRLVFSATLTCAEDVRQGHVEGDKRSTQKEQLQASICHALL